MLVTNSSWNIVLITIDCLRYDIFNYLLKTGRFRFIRNLVNKGVLFRRAYSNAPWTPPSIISMLTSTYPLMYDGYLNYAPRIFLTEILTKNDYITLTYQTNAWISKYFLMDKGFTEFHDEFVKQLNKGDIKVKKSRISNILNKIKELPLSEREKLLMKTFRLYFKGVRIPYLEASLLTQYNVNLIKKYRKEIINSSNKVFLWIHYMDIHEPYYPLKKNIYYLYMALKINEKIKKHIVLNEREKNLLLQLYMDRLLKIDDTLGKLYNSLEELGLNFSNTIFVLTSDHGQEFFEHGLFGHGLHLYNELIHIPLIISGPEVKPSTSDISISLIDLSPTIIGLLGWETRNYPYFRGRDLSKIILKQENNVEESYIFSEEGVKSRKSAFQTGSRIIKLDRNYMKIAIIIDRWKFIYNHGRSNELYDLRRDPMEQNNLINSETDIASELQKIVLLHIKEEEKSMSSQRRFMKLLKTSRKIHFKRRKIE